MPEDIKILRLRAKARAKAQRARGSQSQIEEEQPQTPGTPATAFAPLGQAFSAPGNAFNQEISLAGQQPISETAGGIFNAFAQLPSALLSPIAQLPGGETALRTFASPFELGVRGFRGGRDLIGRGLSAIGINDIPLGPKATQATETIGGAFLAPTIAKTGLAAARPSIAALEQGASNLRSRTATSIGATIGAGENLSKSRQAGQFIVDFKIPSTGKSVVGGNVQAKGSVKSSEVVRKLSDELNTKIIDPATKSGTLIEGKPILEGAKALYDKAATEFIPNRSLLRKLEKELAILQQTIDNSGGKLTPRQVQDYKVRNNQLLEELYRKRDRGSLTEKQAAREAVLLEGNSQLRQSLEQIDPQVKGINWTEGAGLEVTKALDAFLEARIRRDPSLIRGSGISGAAVGRGRLVGLFAITELIAHRPFRVAYNRLLNKAATGVAGATSEFTRPGTVTPFSGTRPPTNPNPFVPHVEPQPKQDRPFPAGPNIAPPSPVTGGVPRSTSPVAPKPTGGGKKLSSKIADLKQQLSDARLRVRNAKTNRDLNSANIDVERLTKELAKIKE